MVVETVRILVPVTYGTTPPVGSASDEEITPNELVGALNGVSTTSVPRANCPVGTMVIVVGVGPL